MEDEDEPRITGTLIAVQPFFRWACTDRTFYFGLGFIRVSTNMSFSLRSRRVVGPSSDKNTDIFSDVAPFATKSLVRNIFSDVAPSAFLLFLGRFVKY